MLFGALKKVKEGFGWKLDKINSPFDLQDLHSSLSGTFPPPHIYSHISTFKVD